MSNLARTTTGEVIDHARLDACELEILRLGGHLVPEAGEPEGCILTHHFAPGLYIRELILPANSINVSRVHKTEHPYMIVRGKVAVFIEHIGWQRIDAPHFGTTYPGTRRLVIAIEDSVWMTFHANPDDERDILTLERRIVELPRTVLEDAA